MICESFLQSVFHGRSELMNACYYGNDILVEHILTNEDFYINYQDEEGETALTISCFLGYKRIVQMLLDCDSIDINHHTNSRETAITKACYKNHHDIIKLLLQYEGVNVSFSTNFIIQPIIYAIYYRNLEMIRLLLDYDPDMNLNYRSLGFANQETPLTLAIYSSNALIVKSLLSHKSINLKFSNGRGEYPIDIVRKLANKAEILKLFEDRALKESQLLYNYCDKILKKKYYLGEDMIYRISSFLTISDIYLYSPDISSHQEVLLKF